MSLNPVLSATGIPLRADGEYLILSRDNNEIEIKIKSQPTISAKGKIFLSNSRIVFVNKDKNNSFKAFEIPLTHLLEERFNQPLFGDNHLSGRVKPYNGLIPFDAEFRLWFQNGSSNKFIKLLSTILIQIRRPSSLGPDQSYIQMVVTGKLAASMVLIDSQDPSELHVNQPENSYNPYCAQRMAPVPHFHTVTGLGAPVHAPAPAPQLGYGAPANNYAGPQPGFNNGPHIPNQYAPPPVPAPDFHLPRSNTAPLPQIPPYPLQQPAYEPLQPNQMAPQNYAPEAPAHFNTTTIQNYAPPPPPQQQPYGFPPNQGVPVTGTLPGQSGQFFGWVLPGLQNKN